MDHVTPLASQRSSSADHRCARCEAGIHWTCRGMVARIDYLGPCTCEHDRSAA